MKSREKVVERKTDYVCPIFKVETLKVELESGKQTTRNIVRHKGAICVIPFKDENTVLMVEQFRVALDDFILEFPAGKLEENEDPMDCCVRELEEETTFTSSDITYLGKIATTVGFCDEIIHIYKAVNLEKGRNDLGDEDEFISLHEISLDSFKELVREGKIIDAKTVAAFGMLNL